MPSHGIPPSLQELRDAPVLAVIHILRETLDLANRSLITVHPEALDIHDPPDPTSSPDSFIVLLGLLLEDISILDKRLGDYLRRRVTSTSSHRLGNDH